MKTHGNFAAYTNCLEEHIIFMNKKVLCVGTTHQTLQKEVFVIDVAQVFFTKSKKVTLSVYHQACLKTQQN